MPSSEMILQSLEGVNVSAGIAGLGQTLVNFDTTQQGFSLVNESAQVVAGLTSTFMFLNPINIETETFAAATTAMKIALDIEEGHNIDPGDVLTLVGDVSGALATVAFYAELPGLAVVTSAVAISLTVGSIVEPVISNAVNSIATTLPTIDVVSPPSELGYLTINNTILTLSEIEASGAQPAGFRIDAGGNVTLVPVSLSSLSNLTFPANINSGVVEVGSPGGDTMVTA
jgi:hypothetical protein